MRLLQNYDGTDLSNPQRSRGGLVCLCGNDIFATMGDAFGFTAIQCIKCNESTSILESTLIAEKLLSAYGEDYCKVFGRIDNTILRGGIVMVDYLVFTEFQTKVTLSIDDRLQKIILAKEDAINKEWYERAARLRDEERIIDEKYDKSELTLIDAGCTQDYGKFTLKICVINKNKIGLYSGADLLVLERKN